MVNHLGQAIRTPDFMADASLQYYADIFRAVIDHLGTPGRRDSKSLLVQPYSGGGMNIQITAGTAQVQGTDRSAVDASVGLSLQGSYIARVDATLGPISIATAPTSGSRTDNVYLVVSDKTENAMGYNDAYSLVQASTVAAPKSALLIGTVTVPAGAGMITAAMIAQGVRSQPPALTDPSYGFVDKKSTDTAVGAGMAAKRMAKLALGSAPYALGTNIKGVTLPATGQSIPNATWTAIHFSNSSPTYIDYNAVNILDDGDMYSVSAGGFVPLVKGWYRISATFGFGTSTGGTNRGVRAISAGGRQIVSVVSDPSVIGGSNPLAICQTFYWPYTNNTSDPILIQLYQNSGAAMQIHGQNYDGAHMQTAVLERLT